MGDIGDYWNEHKEYRREQEAKFWNSPAGRAKAKRKAHQIKRRINRAKEFTEAHGLIYTMLQEGYPVEHTRVKNIQTKKFVDWWSTGTLRNVDGTYGHVGENDINLLAELQKLI